MSCAVQCTHMARKSHDLQDCSIVAFLEWSSFISTFIFTAQLLIHNKNTMPSQTLYSTLLMLGEKDGLTWMASSLQVLLKTYGPPQITDPDSNFNASSLNIPKWIMKVSQVVKTFAHNVWSKDPDEQDNLLRIMVSIFRYSILDHDSRPSLEPGLIMLFILLMFTYMTVLQIGDSYNQLI